MDCVKLCSTIYIIQAGNELVSPNQKLLVLYVSLTVVIVVLPANALWIKKKKNIVAAKNVLQY